MEIKDFKEYNIADIPPETVSDITKLEHSISSKIHKDVVLIAYQPRRETKD